MLDGNERATATVGAIIDGFGSLGTRKIRQRVTIKSAYFLCTTGAATGPLITGWVADDFVCIVHINHRNSLAIIRGPTGNAP